MDTLIVVSNDKLLQIVPENTPLTDAFLVADDILRQGDRQDKTWPNYNYNLRPPIKTQPIP